MLPKVLIALKESWNAAHASTREGLLTCAHAEHPDFNSRCWEEPKHHQQTPPRLVSLLSSEHLHCCQPEFGVP